MLPRWWFVFLLTVLPISLTHSWNAVGHRLIAQIAYDHLSRHQKIIVNRYNRAVDEDYTSKNMVNASVWLDAIRWKTHDYDVMHYIDIPFSTDGTPLPTLPRKNAVWAVNYYMKVLSDSNASLLEKGIALRIILHVVGDIHQPLHAATRISKEYPDGDHGGNFVLLYRNPVARNLHAYWDKGAGLLVEKRHLGAGWIQQQALRIEKLWPCDLSTLDLNPFHWAQESNALAIDYAYWLPLDKQYQRTAQRIVEQQIALAGCRLAGVLRQ